MNGSIQFCKSCLLAAATLFSLTTLTRVQSGPVNGRVISDESNRPMKDVNVGLEGTAMGAATGKDGHFVIANVPAGTYTLLISSVGYKSQRRKITVETGKVLSLEVQLQKATTALNELVVESLTASEKLELSARAVEAVELSQTKLKTADLGAVMARTQGVSVRRSGGLGSDTRFSLNGLTDDQIRFFLDGIPLEFSGYSFGISNVPVNLIDRVEIYKGVVPIRFGADALGGAVNLVSQEVSAGTQASASYQTGSFGTNRVAANVSYLDKNKGFFVNTSGFYDYAKNNYEVDVEVPNQKGKLEEATVPRFHDSYKGYGANAELGIRDKSWAGELSVKGHITNYNKDIQHNNVMSVPYGKVESAQKSYGISTRYSKEFANSLFLKFSGGYSHVTQSFIDTSSYIYNWYGKPVQDSNGDIRKRGTPGEIDKATDRVLWDRNYYSRLNITYHFDGQHALHLSSAPTYVRRRGDERWREDLETVDPLNDRRTVFNWVNGLEYSWSSADDKLENNLFVKGYIQNVQAEEQTNGAPINRNRSFQTAGLGNNIRYALNDQWLVKASYEWATRLPRTNELFGNGSLIRPNMSLKPEKSHNANLGINYTSSNTGLLNWNISLNGFLRSTDRLIVLLSDNEIFRYQNVFSARSTGIEVSGFLKTADGRFKLKGNTTWQSFRNQSSEGEFGRFKGDRIPNRPYFFANLMARYRIPQPFSNTDRLTFFLNNRYVHEFYRGWESVGLEKFKDEIPAQFTQNIGATYNFSFQSLTTSVTAEIQNLTNADVYDFYGVQKPGRAFYLKITTQF